MTITNEQITRSEEETIALGERLGRALRAGDVVALHGDLGAGKTRFVRGIARGMGLDESGVCSPTFVIVNVYKGAGIPDRALVHVDAFRLSGEDDLPSLGWDRLTDGNSVVVVEWAERLADSLPARRISVRIDHLGDEMRRITIDKPAEFAAQAACRICGSGFPRESATFPFCSDRCRLADLSKWFGEGYRITRPMNERDPEEG